jgi:hypothetical protein
VTPTDAPAAAAKGSAAGSAAGAAAGAAAGSAAGAAAGTTPSTSSTGRSPAPESAEGPPAPPDRGWARVHRWRGPVAVTVLVLLAAGTGLALLAPSGGEPLDPRDAGPLGGRALARVLTDHGVQVRLRDRFADLERDLADGPATVLVARPEQLAPGRATDLMRAVQRSGTDLVLVSAEQDVLVGLGLPARAGTAVAGEVRRPTCADPTARRAGAAVTGGVVYASVPGGTGIGGTGEGSGDGSGDGAGDGTAPDTPDDPLADDPPQDVPVQPITGVTACYPALGGATHLVLSHPGGRSTTLLGGRQPLTNDRLADEGDAALAVGVLGGSPRLIWWTPRVTDGGTAARESALDLVPDGVRFGLLQLVVVLAVVVLWRGRRLGRLVVEPLPVVVRAGETTRGRARLYRRARARGRAARVLRAAAARRIALRCGLPRTADPGEVARLVADRTGRPVADVHALLAGAEPADDPALVALTGALDALETEVRSS